MKKFWLNNLALALLWVVLYFIVNYTCGIYDNAFGKYTAWSIMGLLSAQFVWCAAYALARIRRHDFVSVFLGIVFCFFVPLSVVFLWNILTRPVC